MRLLSTLLSSVGITVLTASATPALDQGLILHYTFNGNAQDQSPSANHATPFNGAVLTPDRFGLPSRAFKFNGTSAYLQSAQPLPESDSLTISLWFSLDKWMPAFVAPQVIFFEGDDNPGRDVSCYVAAGLYAVFKSDTGARYENWLPPTNSWTHLGLRRRRTRRPVHHLDQRPTRRPKPLRRKRQRRFPRPLQSRPPPRRIQRLVLRRQHR